ncbi:TldD/PmbA family protein [Candidatus Bipolaricaulota bacterium]|nr:TldD/PmbA family protein [Candidatus Bipolaricaulota bacterium]
MHPLLENAKRTVDQAEMYWNQSHSIVVRYENYRLQQVTENDVSEASLRVIQNGKIGSAYAVFPNQEGFLDNAVTGAQYGDPVSYSFAGKADYPKLDNYSEATAQLKSSDLIEVCESIKTKLQKQLPDVALGIGASCERSELTIQTTQGANATSKSTGASFYFGAPFKGAGVGVFKSRSGIAPQVADGALLDEFVTWYNWGNQSSTPSTGRLPVILAPEAAFLMMMPLLAGVSGEAAWKKTSPLTQRLGEKILSDKLTIYENPLLAGNTDARAFDDEGVPCAKRAIVERGILKEFLFDQRVGAAMSTPSTGNGFKRTMFGSGNETSISPWFCCPTIEPGDTSWHDIVKGIKEGLLITNGMGFHSGNFPQGQFAVQAVGFHIINGAVVGRLDKTMISGNIYQDCLDVAAVSRDVGLCSGFLPLGTAPYVLIDSLQVAGK